MYRVKSVTCPEWDNVKLSFAVLSTFVSECEEEMAAIECAWTQEAIEDAREVVEQYYVQHEPGDWELQRRDGVAAAQAPLFPFKAAPAKEDAPSCEEGEDQPEGS